MKQLLLASLFLLPLSTSLADETSHPLQEKGCGCVKPPQGPPGPPGPPGEPGPPGPSEGFNEGFSATTQVTTPYQEQELVGDWDDTTGPRFNSGSFDAPQGVFQVPATGVYSINATLKIQNPQGIIEFPSERPSFVIANLQSGDIYLSSPVTEYINPQTLDPEFQPQFQLVMKRDIFLEQGTLIGLIYIPFQNTFQMDLLPNSSFSIRRVN